MTIIAVADDYTPEIFRSFKAVAQRFTGFEVRREDDCWEPVTPALLRLSLTRGWTYLRRPEGDEWEYKLFVL